MKTPRLTVSGGGGTLLMKGSALNALLDATRRRTPLKTGDVGLTRLPPALPKSLPAGKTHFFSPAFLQKMNTALAGRQPQVAAGTGPQGFRPGAGGAPRRPAKLSTRPGSVPESLSVLRRMTPRQYGSSSPQGWTAQPEREARATLEVQTKSRWAAICALSGDATEERHLLSFIRTVTFTEGSFTESSESSRRVQTYEAGGTPADSCDLPEYENTFDPEFDYGEFVSDETEPEYRSFTNLRSDAIAALGDWVTEEYLFRYEAKHWRSVSEAELLEDGTWAGDEGSFHSVTWRQGSWMEGIVDSDRAPYHAAAARVRWRLKNEGPVWIRLVLTSRNLDGDLEDEDEITVAPGHVTEWADSGTPSTDLNFTRDLRLTRFKLGPFITLP